MVCEVQYKILVVSTVQEGSVERKSEKFRVKFQSRSGLSLFLSPNFYKKHWCLAQNTYELNRLKHYSRKFRNPVTQINFNTNVSLYLLYAMCPASDLQAHRAR